MTATALNPVLSEVPAVLRDHNHWVLWKTVQRGDDKPTKLPYQCDGEMAKSNDASTWSNFAAVTSRHRQGGYDGIGFEFSIDDEFVGIDLDACRDPATGELKTWASAIVEEFGGQWQTTTLRAGDILVFGMWLMHASLANDSDRFRISSDTRYQPASEAVDGRWVGEHPIGNYAWRKTPPKAAEVSRKEWGV